MTVSELVREIDALVNVMRQITLGAGVPPATFDKVLEVTSSLTIADLEERLSFLRAVRQAEYQRVAEIWRLLVPEVWARYEALGEKQLREQRLLRDARKQLRRAWRKMYGEKESATEQDVGEGSAARERV